jgi:hypothetical protein
MAAGAVAAGTVACGECPAGSFASRSIYATAAIATIAPATTTVRVSMFMGPPPVTLVTATTARQRQASRERESGCEDADRR